MVMLGQRGLYPAKASRMIFTVILPRFLFHSRNRDRKIVNGPKEGSLGFYIKPGRSWSEQRSMQPVT